MGYGPLVEALEDRRLLSASSAALQLGLRLPDANGTPQLNVLSVDDSSTANQSAGGILAANSDTSIPANNQRFVRQMFLDMLGRRPTAGELTTYTGQLNSGSTTHDIATDLLASTDYQTAVIQGFYSSLLRRTGGDSEVGGWLSQIDNGTSVAEIRQSFIASSEYANTQGGGTNAGFIQAAFRDVLNRPATDDELNGYLNDIDIHNASRMNIARSLLTSSGAYQGQVYQAYMHLLHRPPTADELTTAAAQLQGGATDAAMQADVLGTDEYYTAASSAIIVTGTDAGAPPNVKVFDAATGAVKLSFFAYDPAYLGGVRVASADVTGDGVPDVITAPGPGVPPNVRTFDGLTGEQIAGPLGSFFAYDPAFLGGVQVAAGDVNNDGQADIITGVDGGVGPNVKVFSGADGSVLQSFFAYDPAFLGGVRVAAGDINADGHADIITGAGGSAPHVRIFSGADQSLLDNFMAFDNSQFQDPEGAPDLPETAGVFVASGDIDGDGHDDILVSRGDNLPQVRTFSGANGSLIHQYNAYDPTFLAGVRIGAMDANRDGFDDILSGPGFGGGSHVKVCNCSAEVELENFFAYDPSYLGAIYVAGGRR
jgi:hypothetical protein